LKAENRNKQTEIEHIKMQLEVHVLGAQQLKQQLQDSQQAYKQQVALVTQL
jgi:hypothetical protein